MKKNIVLFIFLLMTCIGIEYEFEAYTQGYLTGSQYGHLAVCVALMLLYIIPAALILTKLSKKWETPLLTLGIALVGGMFIAGWLASYGNDFAINFFKHIGASKNFLNKWEPALSPPLIEEPVKLLAVAFALYLLPVKKLKSVLLVGMSAGLGFQISEDLSYIQSDLKEGFVYTVSDILYRITNSISSHWLYTALTAVGLFMIVNYRKDNKKLARTGLVYFLAAFVLHFLWNSPFTAIHTSLPLTSPLISALGIFVFYLLYQQVLKLEQEDLRRS